MQFVFFLFIYFYFYFILFIFIFSILSFFIYVEKMQAHQKEKQLLNNCSTTGQFVKFADGAGRYETWKSRREEKSGEMSGETSVYQPATICVLDNLQYCTIHVQSVYCDANLAFCRRFITFACLDQDSITRQKCSYWTNTHAPIKLRYGLFGACFAGRKPISAFAWTIRIFDQLHWYVNQMARQRL